MCKVSPPCVSLSVSCIDLDFPQCVLVCLSRYQFVTNALQSHECVFQPPSIHYRGTTED